MKVGVVGGGPRALWAAEELVSLFRRHALPLTIICWDPEEPGGGKVYRADQPWCWRLNVRSDIARTHLGAFPEWLGRHLTRESDGRETYRGKTFAAEDKVFVPRAVVGDFLRDSWRDLAAKCEGEAPSEKAGNNAPPIVIKHIRSRVVDVQSVNGSHGISGSVAENDAVVQGEVAGCRIVAEDGSEEFVDEALIVTGHAAQWEGQQPHAIAAHDYPSVESIPAGSNVLIRGMALTFIDVCLALTEGRGGRFVPLEDCDSTTTRSGHPDPVRPGGPAHESLRYIPSGREPAHIYPYSRSGQLMHVKPDPSSPWVNLEIPGQEEFEKRIRNCADVEEMRAIVEEATELVMESARQRAQQRPARPGKQRHPGMQWARGEAWRRLYSAVIERASYLTPGDLEGFYELGREMEPIAFGPPPITAKRIDALVAAGIVVLPQCGGKPADVSADAVHVDAVIAPPGLQPGTVLDGLVKRGEIGMLPEGGPNVGHDGRVPGTHIAVVGRDVEPRVIGHDTLNRAMHKEIPTWANVVLERALRKR